MKSKSYKKLKKDNIQTEKEACNTHNKIGKIVRKAIKEAGGTMPEELPTPKKSLKQLEKEKIKPNNKKQQDDGSFIVEVLRSTSFYNDKSTRLFEFRIEAPGKTYTL